MARASQNDAQLLAERALQARTQSQSGFEASDPVQVPEGIEQPRRMIYSGTMPVPPESGTPTDAYRPSRNQRVTKRRFSSFNIIVTLIFLAVAIVLYISNIIAVDQLMNDIHKTDLRLQAILNEQEMLRAKVNQMSSMERIRERAGAELGLRDPTNPPSWLRVDPDRAQKIEEAIRRR